jgi:hypothetical protein
MNLRSCFSAALLMLPSQFSERDLMIRLVEQSYFGDIRVGWMEDPRKLTKLVDADGALPALRAMYAPLIDRYLRLHTVPGPFPGRHYEQDLSVPVMAELLQALPYRVRHNIAWGRYEVDRVGLQDWAYEIADSTKGSERGLLVRRAIAKQITASSARSVLKGLIANGTARGSTYALAKFRKFIGGLRYYTL